MDINVFTDPTKIGPGLWFQIHTSAVLATTDALKDAYIIYINGLCDNFKCMKCKPHFRKFIDTHPLDTYRKIVDSLGRDIGFFQWSWELHNQVNRFLGKYEPTLEEAYAFFSNQDAGVCFDCPTAPSAPAEQITRGIPPILELFREGNLAPQPFRLIVPGTSTKRN